RRISRSSTVERQVPIIEQCSLVPSSQIRLRQGPCAGCSGIGASPASPLESIAPSTSGFGAVGHEDRDAPCNPLVARIWVSLRAMTLCALYVTRYSEKCQTFSATVGPHPRLWDSSRPGAAGIPASLTLLSGLFHDGAEAGAPALVGAAGDRFPPSIEGI